MAGDRLFVGQLMHEVQQMCSEAAVRAVEYLSEEQLTSFSVEELTDDILADKVPPLIHLDVANHGFSTNVVRLPARHGFSSMHLASGGLPSNEYLEVRLHVPYMGTQQSFRYRPLTVPGQPPEAALADGVVTLAIPAPEMDVPVVEQRLLKEERNLVAWVAAVNADLQAVERQVRSLVVSRLQQRQALLTRRGQLAAAMTIPVWQVECSRALPIPVQRTTAAVTRKPPRAGRSPEWELADPVYEQVIRTVTSFGHALERRPTSALQLIPNEGMLRDWLLFLLNANYEGPGGGEIFVGGETENGKGKTDILLRHEGANAFIGECKFWDGQAKFDDAIDQLLGYTVWRDSKAAIVLFITQRNPTRIIDTAGGRLAGHAQCRQTKVPTDPVRRRDYVFASAEDAQRCIALALLPIVVHATG
jgi:hypothetical protein